MKDDTYVTIQSFMLTDLHLKGNELIVYATIYGFTQDGEHWFYGTKQYLADWCGASKGTIGNCLKSLTEKGLIERRENVERGQTFIEYRALRNVSTPYKDCGTPVQNLDGPHTEIDPINKIDRQPREKISTNRGKKPFVPPTIEEVQVHIEAKGYHFDARQFFDYYEASNWHFKNGKPVKNWKQCCVTWEGNHHSTTREQGRGRNDAYNF